MYNIAQVSNVAPGPLINIYIYYLKYIMPLLALDDKLPLYEWAIFVLNDVCILSQYSLKNVIWYMYDCDTLHF